MKKYLKRLHIAKNNQNKSYYENNFKARHWASYCRCNIDLVQLASLIVCSRKLKILKYRNYDRYLPLNNVKKF